MESLSKKDEVLANLADGIAKLTDSEAWRAWLNVQRRFHNYSFGNTLLILWQRPNTTRVAGFHAWLRLGRHVRKGEKGIAILAPVPTRFRVEDENGEEKTIVGAAKHFRLAHVFDIAQTEGAELPDAPVSKLQGDDPDGLYDQLVEVAHSLGFTVEEDFLEHGINGLCDHESHAIKVEARNEPRQQVKTLAHELGHAILHGEQSLDPREAKELEAESVAYCVCAELGLDSSDYSFGYVATWSGGSQEARRGITASAQRIQKAAQQILGGNTPNDREIAA